MSINSYQELVMLTHKCETLMGDTCLARLIYIGLQITEKGLMWLDQSPVTINLRRNLHQYPVYQSISVDIEENEQLVTRQTQDLPEETSNCSVMILTL